MPFPIEKQDERLFLPPLSNLFLLLILLFGSSAKNVYHYHILKSLLKGIFILEKKKSPFHIGMRTFKTAVSVCLCILLFKLLDRGSPALATIAAVFSLRSEHSESLKFGLSRFSATIVGAVLSVVIVEIQHWVGPHIWADVFLVPIGLIIIILYCGKYNTAGAVAGASTFFIIYFNIESTQSLGYAAQRILDTFIGASISFAVDYFLPNGRNSQPPQ